MKLFAIANAVSGGNILSLFLAALPGRCWLCFFFCLCPCCLQQLLEGSRCLLGCPRAQDNLQFRVCLIDADNALKGF